LVRRAHQAQLLMPVEHGLRELSKYSEIENGTLPDLNGLKMKGYLSEK
jgi:hypothetical protein